MEYITGSKPDGTYVNESERNVHLWCSKCRISSDSGEDEDIDEDTEGAPTLGLIGGCFVHDDWLTAKVLYIWLGMILDLNADQDFRMVLFPCPDPRDNSLEVGDIGPPPTQHLPRDSDEPVVPGHYMLFLSGASQFLSFWPELVMGEFPPRNTTGAQTGTRSSRTGRDDKTRRHVRMRDRRCLVTGQKVPGRERGANFNSMQSAHIFPLMGVGHEGWSEHVPDEIKTMVMTRQDADRPLNALLLRADVHILFDVYEWAVWVGTGPRHKIIRFEKSGAPSLGSYGELDLSHQYPSIGEVQPPNLGLLRHHFRVALLKHFKGFGMPLPPGRIDTLL